MSLKIGHWKLAKLKCTEEKKEWKKKSSCITEYPKTVGKLQKNIIGIPEEEKVNEAEEIFEIIMKKTFQRGMTDTKQEIREIQKAHSMIIQTKTYI